MIYLDHGATSYPKIPEVRQAVQKALLTCANPGRGGHAAAMAAAEMVYSCRETAGELFRCKPEQVVFTASCTHGLNMAIRTLVEPGDCVAVSGFEHNAVTRPLFGLGASVRVAGRHLFDWEDTLEQWEKTLKSGVKAAVFTYVSNVFGYILPVQQMAELCRQYAVPFAIDAAQSAGILDVDFAKLGADFIAMPGHKGLLGPQGTGILLCGRMPKPLLFGGTGSQSAEQAMPNYLPEGGEAGTLNVPGIAGMQAGMAYIRKIGTKTIFAHTKRQTDTCAAGLKKLGYWVFSGSHQSGTLSFLPGSDCQIFANKLSQKGVAVRAGLHCAPLAHESAGTLATGTVRLSFGHDTTPHQIRNFLQILQGFQ